MSVSQGRFEISVIPCRSVVESKVEVTCVAWTGVTPFCQLERMGLIKCPVLETHESDEKAQ